MEVRIDYQAAFKRSSGPMALLSPELVMLDVNDDYVEAAGRPAEKLIGGQILHMFPNNPDDPNDTGRSDLQASLERVLASGERDVIPLTKYDVEDPGRPGVFVERYWAIENSPVMASGHISLIVHRAQELTYAVNQAQATVC